MDSGITITLTAAQAALCQAELAALFAKMAQTPMWSPAPQILYDPIDEFNARHAGLPFNGWPACRWPDKDGGPLPPIGLFP